MLTPSNKSGGVVARIKRLLAPRAPHWEPVRAWALGNRLTAASLMLFVLLPSLIYGAYVSVFASPLYETETRFAIRGATHHLLNQGAGSFGGLAMLMRLNTSQEAKIVENYVRSPGIVMDLEKSIPLRSYYESPDIDYWSRLPANASFETLTDYWREMVKVNVDAVSGTVILRVLAFKPDQSLVISQHILEKVEILVARMIDRIREDMLTRAELEVRDAAARSARARHALLAYRNSEGLIDADKSAKSLFNTVTALRDQRLSIETSLKTMLRYVLDDSPTIRELRSQLASVNSEIRDIELQLTKAHGSNRRAASEAIRAYDVLKINSDLADAHTTLSENTLTKARADIDRYVVHVQPYVKPALPERPVQSYPVLVALAFMLKAVMLWVVGVSLLHAIGEHDN